MMQQVTSYNRCNSVVSSYLLREAPVSVLTKSFLGGSLDVSLSLVLQISKSGNLDFGTLFQIQEPWGLVPKLGPVSCT
jgi:hypothetical protein